MERDFTSAILNAPRPVIIGVRLQPFTLGHRLILEQIESSFVTGGFPRFEDLVSSVVICSQTWAENQKMLRSRFRQWATLKLWGTLAGKFHVARAMEDFIGYIQSGDEFPPLKMSDGESRKLSAPHLARLYLFLRRNGYGDVEAWDTPLNVVNVLYAAEMEQEGKITLADDDFREMCRRAKVAA